MQNYNCYSKRGISIPIKTHILNNTYAHNFTSLPDMFYFNVDQSIQMSTNLAQNYYRIIDYIYHCKPKYSMEFVNYPLIKGED